jgi:phosphoglycerate dehydrogenase-like enzyme
MLKIAILDDYQDISKDLIDIDNVSKRYVINVFTEPFVDEKETIEQLKDFEALLIMRERTHITKNIISALKNLKYIVTSGMRNNSIDLEEAKKRKIIVSGTEINKNPTSELTWALILGLARNLKTESENMYQGYWQTTLGFELKGKILGLIGLGNIGSEVARIGKAFGMQVMAWSENLNLNNCKELGKMKKTSFIINTSRGEIINEDDLIIALSTNVIAGAGMDVYKKEPLPSTHKLRFIPNALILPHLGYVTVENYSMFYKQMIENLDACVSGKPIRVINE